MQMGFEHELQQARVAYRAALRRYGMDGTQESRLEWMRAGRRLADAVNDTLRPPQYD